MRSYVVTCRECGTRRTFRYAETAGIAARVHAAEFDHPTKAAWFAAYRWHEKVFLPPPKDPQKPTTRPAQPRLPGIEG